MAVVIQLMILTLAGASVLVLATDGKAIAGLGLIPQEVQSAPVQANRPSRPAL